MRVDAALHLAPPTPRLPAVRSIALTRFFCAAALHAAAIGAAVPFSIPPTRATRVTRIDNRIDTPHIVFIAREGIPIGGGGGGGGNRQADPIRHATGIGHDPITLRVAKPVSTTGRQTDRPTLPAVLLDAKPVASGTVDQIGLPAGGVSYGTSTGPGFGGGVGEGDGTGIGSGRGAGIGPGSGGGIGGGPYRAGGAVTTPRVVTEVRPTYTDDALAAKIQGRVVLELVVQANGHPANIRVVTSLDRGLDAQAIIAARQWRFEPGRLAGTPVDVLVTLMLDFSIR